MVDQKGSGRLDDQQRMSSQEGLLRVLAEAASNSGLSREKWERESTGDGELAVLPESEPPLSIVDDFPQELFASLNRYNHDLLPDTWLRLRLAIHYGVVIPSANGYTGGAPTYVSRMVDSRPIRAALDVSGAPLAVLIAGQLFDETIAQRHTALDPAKFRRVTVRNKELTADAWLYVPGVDVHALDLSADPGEPQAGERGEPGQTSAVTTNFYEKVDARGSIIGISQR